MKKYILFIIISVLLFFNNKIYADTVIPDLLSSYNGKDVRCNTGGNYCYFSTNAYRNVFIYDTKNSSGNSLDFSLKYLNGNNNNALYVGSSNTLYDIANTPTSEHFSLLLAISSPVIDSIYNFSTSERYIYATFTTSVYDGSYGSVEWIGSSSEPEPVPPYEYEFKGLIYVPEDDFYNKCYVVQNEDVIRGYDRIPVNNSIYNYRDYYINSSYIYKDGSGQWSQYSTLPVCLDSDILTNNLYYRLDFDKSLIIFFIISIFSIYLPIKLFSKIFRKGVL